MVFQDISCFFPTGEVADATFTLFDRDGNGDVSLEETEQACAEFHRKQLSIEHSMRDTYVQVSNNVLSSLFIQKYSPKPEDV